MATLSLWILLACSGDQEGRAGSDVSGGTSSPEGFQLSNVPQLSAEQVALIGSMDNPDVGLSSVQAMVIDRDGLVYAFEGQSRQIRVYSQDGHLIRAIGRRGAGPGEFASVPSIGILGDTLWAIEPQRGRLSLFHRDGTLYRTVNFAHVFSELQPTPPVSGVEYPIVGAQVVPAFLRPDGYFVSSFSEVFSTSPPSGTVAPTDTVLLPRVRFTIDGLVVDTIGWEPRVPHDVEDVKIVRRQGVHFGVPPTPSDGRITISLADGYLSVERRRARPRTEAYFQVSRIALEGDTIYSNCYFYEPRPFDDGILQGLADDAARNPGVVFTGSRLVSIRPGERRPTDDEMALAAKEIRREMDFGLQPPVQSVIAGVDGAVWLRRELVPPDSVWWTVLDRQGTPRGNLKLPRSQLVVWVGVGEYWAVRWDEFGSAWLALHRLH